VKLGSWLVCNVQNLLKMQGSEPLVEIAVDDMTKVPAMRYKEFASYINPFVCHTVKFLNRFACVCEEKLADLSLRIQKLEITISLLETKLSSIPGLDDIKIETQEVAQPVPAQQPTDSQPPPQTPSEEQPATEEEDEPAKPATKTIADDPRYQKYLKLLKMGVPLPAFRAKVLAEGLDPDLLENPDAPLPDGHFAGNGDDDDSDEGSSASSFSDED